MIEAYFWTHKTLLRQNKKLKISSSCCPIWFFLSLPLSLFFLGGSVDAQHSWCYSLDILCPSVVVWKRWSLCASGKERDYIGLVIRKKSTATGYYMRGKIVLLCFGIFMLFSCVFTVWDFFYILIPQMVYRWFWERTWHADKKCC